jgi:hypothetical protein
MKIAETSRLVFGVLLFVIASTRAAVAAEINDDRQEQARLMLSGRSFPANETKSRVVISPSQASNAVALDPQEQAREMILARPAVAAFGVRREADGSLAAGASVDRTVDEDAQEVARRMILGSHSRPKSTKPRLAQKGLRAEEAQ